MATLFKDFEYVISRTKDVLPKQENFYRHCHNSYELFFFIEGEANYVVENKLYELTPYSLLFIKPTIYHYLQLKNMKAYYRMVINIMPNTLSNEFFKRFKNKNALYHFNSNSEITKILMSLESKKDIFSTEDYNEFVKIKVNEVLINLLYIKNNTDSKTTYIDDDTLSLILKYINENLYSYLNIDIISKALFLSKSHISHIFSDRMKIGIMQYIKEKKILLAQTLIRAGGNPTEIAKECGFNEYSSFYRLYKLKFGVNPAHDKGNKI